MVLVWLELAIIVLSDDATEDGWVLEDDDSNWTVVLLDVKDWGLDSVLLSIEVAWLVLSWLVGCVVDIAEVWRESELEAEDWKLDAVLLGVEVA